VIRGLFMVELRVSDWDTSVHWYGEVLGLLLVPPTEPGKFALFESGGCRVALIAGEPVPGGVQLTFEVDDLAAELARLAKVGIVPVKPMKVSPEGYRRAIVLDPDGYRVCLFEWVRTNHA
jgi:predicted enzyme related to lactoylglutathione lyase